MYSLVYLTHILPLIWNVNVCGTFLLEYPLLNEEEVYQART